MANKKSEMIKIKLVKSLIGSNEKQRRVVKGLGLSKKDQVVEHASTPTILGMVNKISHLVEIVK
ncbi:MAG: 50S ribosomal protein L30 [Cyanobacteriota bacterium]|nr:50S ribosomal protein L30 [Cyanobacteriota bacterium]